MTFDKCFCKTFTMSPSVSTDFNVPMPTWDSVRGGLQKDVQLFNMWEGEIETVDRGLNNQGIALSGVWRICGEWEGFCFPICFPICFSEKFADAIEHIHSVMNDGEEVTVTGLEDCLDAVYVIKSFNLNTIVGTNTGFSYYFDLEKVRDI